GGRRLVVKQVCDADTRPQYGPKRAIKRHQLRRRSRAQLCIERFEQHRADPSCTEKLALQPQVVHLVIGVQNTHAAIELEAVNDQRWRGQADMLGPQIPMTFHDVASHDPASISPRTLANSASTLSRISTASSARPNRGRVSNS